MLSKTSLHCTRSFAPSSFGLGMPDLSVSAREGRKAIRYLFLFLPPYVSNCFWDGPSKIWFSIINNGIVNIKYFPFSPNACEASLCPDSLLRRKQRLRNRKYHGVVWVTELFSLCSHWEAYPEYL